MIGMRCSVWIHVSYTHNTLFFLFFISAIPVPFRLHDLSKSSEISSYNRVCQDTCSASLLLSCMSVVATNIMVPFCQPSSIRCSATDWLDSSCFFPLCLDGGVPQIPLMGEREDVPRPVLWHKSLLLRAHCSALKKKMTPELFVVTCEPCPFKPHVHRTVPSVWVMP